MKKITKRLFSTKLYKNSLEALHDAKDGSSFCVPGFGIVGIPENSLQAIHQMKIKHLTLYTNSVGLSNVGHGPLITSGQVDKVFVSFLGFHHIFEKMYLTGKAYLNPIPQGSLVEKMRSAKSGIAGFFTRTGVGTLLQSGKFPVKYNRDGSIAEYSKPKESMIFDGVEYLLEETIQADYSIIRGFLGDKYGNIRFRKIARNFNPDIAGAGKITVAEVEHLVEKLPPDQVHLPGVFVDRIYEGEHFGRKIERLVLPGDTPITASGKQSQEISIKLTKIAKRLAKEFKDGMYINLGVGLPGEAPQHVPAGVNINFQVENGIVGAGKVPSFNEIDPDLVNAGKMAITAEPGHSFTSSDAAFGIMRGHHLHMTVLGSLEVSQEGDLANYFVPKKMYRGVGGAMDLCIGCDNVLVGMYHCTDGKPRIIPKCTLPVTATRCITKLVTEYAVFEFTKEAIPKMMLLELVPELTVDELKKITPAKFYVSPNLRKYQE